MNTHFKQSLGHVLIHEGGYINHPHDPGGPTMHGITLETFRNYYGADKKIGDLIDITREQCAHIYKSGCWDACNCDNLPAGVDYAVFDSAVNSGQVRASKWLQFCVGALRDGIIGPHTLRKVVSHNPEKIIDDMLDRHLRFLRSLRTWSTFGRGWKRRIEDVRTTALAML